MKLRPTLGSAIACVFALGVTACGDDERHSVITPDAGNALTPTDTSESSSSAADTAPASETSAEGPQTGAVTVVSNETSNSSTAADQSAVSVGTDASSASSSAPFASSTPGAGETSSQPPGSETTVVVEPCAIPPFSVFSRSDTDATWDDNDFSAVLVDSSQCPPAVYVDATWPHEPAWANADPSEANHEQVHFTLDSYGATNLVDKEVTATVELVADERGPAANAGGYLVSIVSVSTFDRITVIPAVVEPDAGADASAPEPQIITETGYSEAESAPKDRILLRRVGDRATVSFRLPAKTEAVDSYDPERVLKINLRVYNVFEGLTPVQPGPSVDAGSVDAVETSADAAPGAPDGGVGAPVETTGEAALVAPVVEGDPSLVYDYLTSRFAITKFTISDVAGAPVQ